jgi:anionic cell wall polymer biosynthesis LytR-Cps2A-Psr (LCP) family protein
MTDELSRSRARRTTTKKKFKQTQRKKLIIGIAVLCGFVLVVFAGLLIGSGGRLSAVFPFLKKQQKTPLYKEPAERVTILLIGTNSSSVIESADALMLMTYNPKTKKLDIISVPKNTLTDIPGHNVGEIGQAYTLGKVSLTIATMEYLFGVPIDHYIKTDRRALQTLVDDIKGVEIQGKTFSGKGSIEYISLKEDNDTQLDRIGREHKLLQAVLDKAKGEDIQPKISKIVRQIKPLISTDMSTKEISDMAILSTQLDKTKVKMQVTPVKEVMMRDKVQYQPQKTQLEALVNKVFGSDRWKGGSKGDLKVRVLNGVGDPGVANEVARLMIESGYKVIDVKNADNFDYTETELIIYSTKSADMVKANKVKSLLSVGKIILNNLPQDVADMTIIIGKDFKSKEYELKKKVEILNGTGKSEVVAPIKDKLTAAGYEVVNTANADRPDYQTTKIIIQVDNDKVKKMADDIKVLLGTGEITTGGASQSEIEITVIVGADL